MSENLQRVKVMHGRKKQGSSFSTICFKPFFIKLYVKNEIRNENLSRSCSVGPHTHSSLKDVLIRISVFLQHSKLINVWVRLLEI